MNELCVQIAAILEASRGSDDSFKQVFTVVLAHFHSETGTIHRLNPETQLLHLTAQVGLPPAMVEMVRLIPVGKGIAGQTVARGEPVTMCNLQTDQSGTARPGARQTGVGGALCVPVRNGPNIVGAIGIGTMREHEYTPEETQLLEEVGRLIGASFGPVVGWLPV